MIMIIINEQSVYVIKINEQPVYDCNYNEYSFLIEKLSLI